jgi:hypothetical protein
MMVDQLVPGTPQVYYRWQVVYEGLREDKPATEVRRELSTSRSNAPATGRSSPCRQPSLDGGCVISLVAVAGDEAQPDLTDRGLVTRGSLAEQPAEGRTIPPPPPLRWNFAACF